MVGENTEKVIELNALRDIESERVKIIDFKKSEYLPLAIPNACKYRRLNFPKELLDAHFVINMLVLKTHDYFLATLGLKNMKGVLKDVDKRRFHTLGLEEGIIDTNRVALADFTIIDGIIGMEGSGSINGIPANSRIIIGSDNALAAEIIALKVMGVDFEHIPYIQMAYDAGFGEKNLDKIEVVEAKCEEVIKKFQLSNANKQDFFDGSISITEECKIDHASFEFQNFAINERYERYKLFLKENFNIIQTNSAKGLVRNIKDFSVINYETLANDMNFIRGYSKRQGIEFFNNPSTIDSDNYRNYFQANWDEMHNKKVR